MKALLAPQECEPSCLKQCDMHLSNVPEIARPHWLFNISTEMPLWSRVYLLLRAAEDIFFQFKFLSKSRRKRIWLRCQVLKSRWMNVMYKNRNAIVILHITIIHNESGRSRQVKPVLVELISVEKHRSVQQWAI